MDTGHSTGLSISASYWRLSIESRMNSWWSGGSRKVMHVDSRVQPCPRATLKQGGRAMPLVLEHLARHHRKPVCAHINALEALLLQALPGSGVNGDTLKATLSKLLPNQPEAEQSASDRAAVLLGLHNSSGS